MLFRLQQGSRREVFNEKRVTLARYKAPYYIRRDRSEKRDKRQHLEESQLRTPSYTAIIRDNTPRRSDPGNLICGLLSRATMRRAVSVSYRSSNMSFRYSTALFSRCKAVMLSDSMSLLVHHIRIRSFYTTSQIYLFRVTGQRSSGSARQTANLKQHS